MVSKGLRMTYPNHDNSDLIQLLQMATKKNTTHNWECESSSDYDDILRCTKCKKTYFQMADKWGDEPPVTGCTWGKNE